MPDFVIYPEHEPASPWRVRVGDCDRAHAESVLAQLEHNPDVPSALVLSEADAEVMSKGLLRRIFRG